MEIPQIINGSGNDNILLLAHGAGAGMDSAFMEAFSLALSGKGIKVVRFEFPYMAKIKETGKKRPPDRAPILLDTFYKMLTLWREQGKRVFIGGKSMGGRMATMLMAASDEFDSALINTINGCISLGYPFHPPGKPEKTRMDHFPLISKPVLIVQGENDAFGKRSEIDGYNIPSNMQVTFVAGGNHDLKASKKYGKTHDETIEEAAQFVSDFINGVAPATYKDR